MGSVKNIVRRGALPSLALLLLVAAGLGCQAGGRKSGEACAESADCRVELACFEGECVAPGSCPNKAPVNCGDGTCCPQAFSVCCDDGNCYGSPAECKAATCSNASQKCTLSTDCCTGLTCQVGTCRTPPTTCAGRACSTSAGCCAGFTCSRFGKTCRSAKNLVTGDACTDSGQCAAPGMCLNGYCTKFCSKMADCGPANYCLAIEGGQFVCVPYCQGNADCSVFGIGITCQQSTDPGGLTLKGCFGS